MSFSAVKHFLCSAILGAFCITFLSGCIAMVLERPLSEANEFQDENLDGVWMMEEEDGSKPKDAFVFEIKNVEKHHYALLWLHPARVIFTTSRIPDGKGGSFRFASIVFDDPDNQKGNSCMLVRYAALSPDEIGVYNVTKELQDAEDYRKLCTDPEKKDIVTAGPDAVRKWCRSHAEEMELIFKLKRVLFKSDDARRKFIPLAAFLQEHARRMAGILAASKDSGSPITPEQQKKIAAEFGTVRKWVAGSKEMFSPELTVIFDQYVSIPLSGRSGKEVLHEIDTYTRLIRRIALCQMLE